MLLSTKFRNNHTLYYSSCIPFGNIGGLGTYGKHIGSEKRTHICLRTGGVDLAKPSNFVVINCDIGQVHKNLS
jgi:hypothetical protein